MRMPSSPGEGAGYDAWRPGGAPQLLERGAPDSIMDTCYMPNNPAHYGLDMFAGEGEGLGAGGGASPEPAGGSGGSGGDGAGLGSLVLGGPPLGSPGSAYGVSAPLSPQDTSSTLHGCLAPQGAAGGVGGYWPDDMMASFSLPPLDLDPLPSIFPFSPAPAFKSEYASLKEPKPAADVSDVLLQLKHAVVHPGQLSPSGFTYSSSPYSSAPYPGSYSTPYSSSYSTPYAPQPTYTGPSASLSYTVHPQMMSSSPSGSYGSGAGFCGSGPLHQVHHPMEGSGGSAGSLAGPLPGPLGGTAPGPLGGPLGATPPAWPPAPTHFPSMSVNVSMNMTMHGYPPNRNVNMNMDNLGLQHQVQWTAAPAPPSPSYGGGLLSPQPHPYPAATTYSFTADFRPPPTAPTAGEPSSFKPVLGSLKQGGMRAIGAAATPGHAPGAPSPASSESSSSMMHSCTKLGSMSPTTPGADDASRPNLCRICGKTYARPSTLKTHLRTHSGEKPYRCDDCNKSFSQAANLTAHVRTHSGEKPFRCPICDRRFSQSSSVTTHMRTHSGERPYRCRHCKKAFSDSSTLTKHLRIHSGEKPYQCKLCLLRFSQSGNLNRHMRVHGGSGTASPSQLMMMPGA